MSHFFLFLFLTLIPTYITSHLIAIAPKTAVVGTPYPIRVQSNDAGTTTATIYGGVGTNTAAFTSIITQSSSSTDITLSIPSTTTTGIYRLDITTTTNTSAIYRSDIQIWNHPYDVAIELDKPVYQPGQTVYIQLIVIDINMKPVQLTGREGVMLVMSDAKQTKLARISNISTDIYGMSTLSLPLSSEPSYGTYTLTLSRDTQSITSTTFELLSYQLPKFSVQIGSGQKSITSTSTSIMGNVTAMYVYGKPVIGKLVINITQAPNIYYNRWGDMLGGLPMMLPPMPMVDAAVGVAAGGGVSAPGTSVSSPTQAPALSLSLSLPLDASGVTRWNTPLTSAVSSSAITVTATVVEDGTGMSETSNIDIPFAWNKIQSIITCADTAVKPGIPLSCIFLAVDSEGKPINRDFTLVITQTLVNTYSQTELTSRTITTVDGRVLFDVTGVSSQAASVNVQVKTIVPTAKPGEYVYPEITYYSLSVAYSPSSSYIDIVQTSSTLTTGSDGSFTIKSMIGASGHDASSTTLVWTVISQGDIVNSGKTNMAATTTGINTLVLPIPITSAIRGSATVLVYIRLSSGEVIADSLPITVPVAYPQGVTASFASTQAQPGDNIDININTAGVASRVVLAAIDTAVLLVAGQGSRINIQSILKASDRTSIASLISSSSSSSKSSPIYYGYRQRVASQQIFNDANVLILQDFSTKLFVDPTNTYVYADGGPIAVALPPVAPGAGAGGPVASAPAPGAGSANSNAGSGAESTSKDASTSTSASTAAPTRIRSYFPESFLTFHPIMTDNTGKSTTSFITPDSITTWDMHAIAMSTSNGLGISTSSKLQVMLPLFIDVYLPKVAIRGEQVPITVAVKNYLSSAATVTITLATSTQYPILSSSSSTGVVNNNHIYVVDIQPSSIVGVTYIIKPSVLGVIQIQANSTSSAFSDGIITPLTVQPEGIPRSYTFNQLITLDTTTTTSTQTWQTYLPYETVDGSATAYLYVTGDLLGQVMNNLDYLVQQPTGCGEQNMVLFAPIIYVTSYITSAQLSKQDLVQRAIQMMRVGYARELTYRRTDGSFSAFGNNDPIGSIWLSSFVLKCFAQSRVHTNLGMYIDPQVLSVTADYIISKQLNDGSYPLLGKVFHDDMTGGVGQTASPALTAYITLSLIETGGYTSAVNKGINYLISQSSSLNGNLYQTILLAYTLKRSGSTSTATTTLYEQMKAAAKQDTDGTYWSSSSSQVTVAPTTGNKQAPMWYCYSCQPRSLDVEMTSYALLTLLAYDDLVAAFPVAKWLIHKRNSNGGYYTTQDTVVALEALSAYAIKALSTSDITLSILQDNIASKQITINKQNSDLLQSYPIQISNMTSLTINTQGKGRVLVQLAVFYHVNTDTTTPSYIMNIDYAKSGSNNDLLQVQACVQSTTTTTSKNGMVITEVGLFTGYEPVASSLSALTASGSSASIRRVDTAPRQVILYWSDILNTNSFTCITFTATRTMTVQDLKPAISSTYSYYATQYAVTKSIAYSAASTPVVTPAPPQHPSSHAAYTLPSTVLILFVTAVVVLLA